MNEKIKVTTFENASVMRKFTIFFLLMSIIPVGVLWYLYVQVRDYGKLELTESNFSLTLFFIVTGVGVGYYAMRTLLMSLIDITRTNKNTIREVLGADKLKEITSGEHNEIAVLAKSFNEITSRLEENIRNLEVAKKTLHSVLAKVGEGISSMQNIDSFLGLIVETVTDALQAKVGVLLLCDEDKKDLYVKSVYGQRISNPQEIRLKMDEGTFAAVITNKKPLIVPRLQHSEKSGKKYSELFDEPLICAPLILHDKVLGVISVSGKREDIGTFDTEELSLLYNLALQTAVAIENSRLNQDAEKTYFETISALAMAVDAKDHYSRGHLDRVAKYTTNIAQQLGLSQEDQHTLRDAARLHDVGKIGVTDEVLTKPGPLNSEEWSLMKKHPEIGEGIIKPVSSLLNICDIVRHHHEMLDGSGYPDGLKGEQIHPLVRILTVADIYDALTTDRPYRKAFSSTEAAQKLREMKNKIDQKIVNALLESLK